MEEFSEYKGANNIERQVNSVQELNKILLPSDMHIIHLNVRGLKSNHSNVEVLIKNMDIKPDVIVCSETWNLEFHHLYNIDMYKTYYNKGSINKADGVVIYVKSSLMQETKTEEIGSCKILTTTIKTVNDSYIKISGLYRSHDITKENLIKDFYKYLVRSKKIKNHCIVGDFNIDILKSDNNSTTFLTNLLEAGYIPYFS